MLCLLLASRIAADLLFVVTVSASYIAARWSWSFFQFLHIQSPTQFQFLLLGVCLFYTCLRCAVIIVLHHPILTGIYTYIFSAGSSHEPPNLLNMPGFLAFCFAVSLIYGMRWRKSYLVTQRRVRPTLFSPPMFTRPFQYWIMTRRRHSSGEGRAAGVEQQDIEKLLPTQTYRPRCDSCNFLFDNSHTRRAGACYDLVCVVVLIALVDLYLANRNGWVSENMGILTRLFNDILSWEYCNIFFWFTWIDAIVACLEARFEWNVGDQCRRKKSELSSAQTQGPPIEK